MRKIIISIVSNTVMILLPLVLKPELMVHPKILILILTGVIIWLTQPVFSIEETQNQKHTDRFTVVLILSMSFISIFFPVCLWAYGMNDINHYGILFTLGILSIILGMICRVSAIRELGKYFTPTVQIQSGHNLVTSGPYRFIRHPSYTGAFLVITGCSLVLGTWIGYLVSCIAMGYAYFVRTGIEERELETYFGDKYRNYRKGSKKMIPFVW